MSLKNPKHGFTLIELLIVIAIILILIAIALPNFLEAQVRAKITRTKADMRGLGTSIESFRTERGVLLIDFWDDGTPEASLRWQEKLGRIGRDPRIPYDYFEECFYPLTSPVKYIQSPPIDLWNDPSRQVGFSASETGLAYIYFDNDNLFKGTGSDHGIEVYEIGSDGMRLFGITPLREGEFGMLSIGPDRVLGSIAKNRYRGLPYSPTNGTNSGGEIVFRSGAMVGY